LQAIERLELASASISFEQFNNLEPVNLWGTLKKNIPVLKKEIQALL
jgi:hypothetical protein